MNLEGKVALVTGASRGIGRECAMNLARHGAVVAINYSKSSEEAENVVELVKKEGGKAIAIQADVSDPQDAQRLIDETIDKLGGLDILVNNAGITRDTLLIRMKEEDWDQVIDVNLKSVYNCTKAAARYMMKKRQGRIINISSVVGVCGNPGQANYAAAKAGIIGFSKSIAKELAARGILVNVIAPGFIETDMTEVLQDNIKEAIMKNIPLGYFGSPSDVANLALFLASEKSRYITGQVIHVDGGMVM